MLVKVRDIQVVHQVGLFKKISITILMLCNLAVLIVVSLGVAIDEKNASSFGGECVEVIAERNNLMMDAVLITNLIYFIILAIIAWSSFSKRKISKSEAAS